MPSLSSLEYISYIDANGQLPEQFQAKVGVYAIFDRQQVLQYVGYSRDVDLSLKQHLVRQPQLCYWLKVQTIDRPSRTILENIQQAWIAENGALPAGNGIEEAKWTQPIDAKVAMTVDEQTHLTASDELTQAKLLKDVARRVEGQISSQLESRGVKMQLRFNPKLKEKGLLDLK
ncbi:MAG: GIY-YIG nuclease family protein [Chroococcidiopsidaceae cyanobacterium CP_BM_ER_R8_30]|nr:GIY-YIG nuclease family protein [Chroococcidiopsidaceae cyanobacterium CP_BM_ER_R8_30]